MANSNKCLHQPRRNAVTPWLRAPLVSLRHSIEYGSVYRYASNNVRSWARRVFYLSRPIDGTADHLLGTLDEDM